MDTIEIRYRGWFKFFPPQPIKLKIPGWAGVDHTHENGSQPQPWHCPPFVDGSTYGCELIYPFDTECHIKNINGEVKFEANFTEETPAKDMRWPPFEMFAPGHYGFTSCLDIVGPPGYVIRVESHPKYYTDETWATPCVVPGHIQTEWWSRIFFIVFKTPAPGQCHVFKKGQPYAQILVLPKKVTYDIVPMDMEETVERSKRDSLITKGDKHLAENVWTDDKGHVFNDKYKVLSRYFNKGGIEEVQNYLNANEAKSEKLTKQIKPKFVRVKKNETLQDSEEKTQ